MIPLTYVVPVGRVSVLLALDLPVLIIRLGGLGGIFSPPYVLWINVPKITRSLQVVNVY